MRYTTSPFGEVATALGEFQTGRTAGQVIVTVQNLTTLDDITPGLADLILLLNDIKAQYEAHRVLTAGGVHGAADSTNVVTAPDATDWSSAVTLANDIKAKYNAHRVLTAGGVHGAADNANPTTSADATSISTAVTLANELRTDYEAHRVRITGGCHGAADTTNVVTEAAVVQTGTYCTESVVVPSVYYWKTSSLETQPTVQSELIVRLKDTVTGQEQRCKIVLGGHTDDAAISRYGNSVHIDVTNGSAGTAYPLGTPTNPVNNIADAYTIAVARGLRSFTISGAVTADRNYTNWEFLGAKSTATSSITLAGYDFSNSSFDQITMIGTIGGSLPKQLSCGQCVLEDVLEFDGIADGCGIRGEIRVAAGGSETLLNDCRMVSEYPSGILNFNDAANDGNVVKWGGCAGYMGITGMKSNSELTMGCTSVVIIWAGNTGGTITIGGLAVYAFDFDAPGAKTFAFDETYNREVWGDLPWDEDTDGHWTVNTFGRAANQTVMQDTRAQAGSTSTVIKTLLTTHADDFFNNMQVLVVNASGTVVRNIDDFEQSEGKITVEALPFTPATNDPVIILGRTGSVPLDTAAIATAVWDEVTATYEGDYTKYGGIVKLIEQILRNKLQLADGSSGNWVLRDDGDSSDLLTWDVTDKSGNPVILPDNAPARRSRGT